MQGDSKYVGKESENDDPAPDMAGTNTEEEKDVVCGMSGLLGASIYPYFADSVTRRPWRGRNYNSGSLLQFCNPW